MYSLKRLLLFSLLCSSLLLWIGASYIDYTSTEAETMALFDAELAQSAKVLDNLIEGLLRQHSLSLHWQQSKSIVMLSSTAPGQEYERKLAFQLVSKKNGALKLYGVILRSDNAPVFPLSSISNGYSKMMIDGQQWHVFSLSDADDAYVIHVAQRNDVRERLIAEISRHAVVHLSIRLSIFALLIWLIVTYALKPVEHLAAQLAERKASYLKPLLVKRLPIELVPVVDALNGLFLRLEKAFENERRFTADAAHELKTPLAGLRTQAQVALKTTDENVRNQALIRIEQALDRMTHTLQQLLTLAEIESGLNFLSQERCDLEQLLLHILGELEPSAYHRQIDLAFVHEQSLFVEANPALMEILMTNLITNAIKYTPTGGKIQISLERQANIACFRVEDSGSGIAEDDYERVFKRFYRDVETASKVEGSGLGLSIVKRIIALHEAEIKLNISQFGGLQVSVSFPCDRV